jgi:hypothetical protein
MMLAKQDMKAPPYLLPPLQSIIATMGTATGASWTDDEGYYSRSVTPFPTAVSSWSPQLMSGIPAPMLLGVALPAISTARKAGNQQQGKQTIGFHRFSWVD